MASYRENGRCEAPGWGRRDRGAPAHKAGNPITSIKPAECPILTISAAHAHQQRWSELSPGHTILPVPA
ncbi:MAG TPA: hypothetical protein PLE42_10760, partial [Candidatus Competibacteraceae bacterium]|nr:hypothetical protein [Candidatus Competibacteraceae bacterium]